MPFDFDFAIPGKPRPREVLAFLARYRSLARAVGMKPFTVRWPDIMDTWSWRAANRAIPVLHENGITVDAFLRSQFHGRTTPLRLNNIVEDTRDPVTPAAWARWTEYRWSVYEKRNEGPALESPELIALDEAFRDGFAKLRAVFSVSPQMTEHEAIEILQGQLDPMFVASFETFVEYRLPELGAKWEDVREAVLRMKIEPELANKVLFTRTRREV